MLETICLYKGNCSGEPFSCSTCKHNTGKKNHYAPDITYIPNPHWHFEVPYNPSVKPFKDNYTIMCTTPVKITLPKPRGKKC